MLSYFRGEETWHNAWKAGDLSENFEIDFGWEP